MEMFYIQTQTLRVPIPHGLISTHLAQLKFARHSVTIHRIYLYPEKKIHVVSTAGKLDDLEAPKIF